MDFCEHSGASLLPATAPREAGARHESAPTVYPASALSPALKAAEEREAEIARLTAIIDKRIPEAMVDGWTFRAAARDIYEDRQQR